MTSRISIALVSVLGLLSAGAIGCKSETQMPASRPVVAAGSGSIAGSVMFEGEVPAPRVIANQPCHPGAKPIYDDSLVVDPAGGLRNVVVYLLDGPNVATSAGPALLDQASCQYSPHVLAVRTGQSVTFKSSDPTLHNVHGLPAKNRAFNLAMTDAGETKEVTFAQAEIFRVRCDVHHWMSAYVAVFDHPFFAVTGDGGGFELKGVPAGSYTLVAWHEKYGEKRQPITVTDGQASAAFKFGK